MMLDTANNMMNCVEIPNPGPPSVLAVAKRSRPQAGPDDVVIQVCASGVNYPDILQRQGRYNVPSGASDLPGLEVAGIISEVGSSVTDFAVGDRVCALTPGGGYSEYCRTPAAQCLPIPAGITMAQAASLPEVYFTVWFNLVMQGQLSSGQVLLVHGGSGGIGTAAIQMAAYMGVTVYATAGSDEKCEACCALGASVAINYRTSDFVDVIRDETGGKGVDMVLDMVGGDYVNKNLECLAIGGRLINLFFMKGSVTEVDLMPVLAKNLTVTGSLLRPQPIMMKKRIAKGLRETVWPLIETGVIRPLVYKTFPMKDAASAHEMMEGGQHIGKVVLMVAE